MKKLRKQIEAYIPVNEQEIKDKEILLKYILDFKDILTRQNEYAHFTSSALVLNKTRDKALLIFHNIYKSWGWVGGHADGEANLLEVAIKEAKEETGVSNIKPIMSDIASLDILSIWGHFKKGKYVSSHIHLSVAYLLEADETEPLIIKEDENSNVAWIPIDKILESSTEEHMKPIYEKLLNKIKNL